MIPSQLHKTELRFVLLGKWDVIKYDQNNKPIYKGKAPFEKGWATNGYTFEDKKLLRHISQGNNFGVIGGYGRLRILDIDNPQLAEELEKKIQTYTIKTGSGGRHFYFYSDYEINHVLVNKQGELRAKNYQVVSAPCRHPSGKYYTIVNDSPIVEINSTDLFKIIKPYLRKEEAITKTIQTDSKERDTSRSGKDMTELCKLLFNGLTKEGCFKEMEYSAKWSSAPEQYKEKTFEKAVAYVHKINKEKRPDNFERDTGLQNTDLKTFIFDKTQVIQNKVFSSHLLSNSLFGFGMLLPREEDKKDGTGKILYTYQTWRGVILTSNQRGLVVSEWLKKEHKINYECVPAEMKLRWELEDIRKYLDGKAEQVNGLDLFNLIKEQYEHYNFYREKNWYAVNTLWDIGTYLHQLFSAYPLKENRGLAGTGKSKSMNVSSYITLNATDIMTNPSEATLFRETEILRPTKYIDEAEKLFKMTKFGLESDNRVELINASYTRNGSVPRQEKLGKGYVTKWYHVYSPTQLSSINGLYGATESRAITQIHTKSPDIDIRGERDPEDDINNPKWKSVRNKCYLWTLQNWKVVYDYYLNFDIPTTLKKRDMQLWKPLLVLAKIIDEKELLPNILLFAERLSNQRKNDLLNEESLDYKFLFCVNELLKENVEDNKLFVNAIRIKYNDEYKKSEPTDTGYNRTISNHLDKLGFKDLRYKDHKRGAYFLLSKQMFEEVVNPITSDFASQSSQSSQNKGKTQNKGDEVGTKQDDNKNNKGDERDDTDERDDSIEQQSFDNSKQETDPKTQEEYMDSQQDKEAKEHHATIKRKKDVEIIEEDYPEDPEPSIFDKEDGGAGAS